MKNNLILANIDERKAFDELLSIWNSEGVVSLSKFYYRLSHYKITKKESQTLLRKWRRAGLVTIVNCNRIFVINAMIRRRGIGGVVQ